MGPLLTNKKVRVVHFNLISSVTLKINYSPRLDLTGDYKQHTVSLPLPDATDPSISSMCQTSQGRKRREDFLETPNIRRMVVRQPRMEATIVLSRTITTMSKWSSDSSGGTSSYNSSKLLTCSKT